MKLMIYLLSYYLLRLQNGFGTRGADLVLEVDQKFNFIQKNLKVLPFCGFCAPE